MTTSAFGAAALVVVLVLAACGPAEPETIDRDAFIATYVDLRQAALRSPERVLSEETRARVLAQHAVTEEELMEFTSLRGGDPAYMIEVWSEISARMDPAPPLPDSAG